MTNSASPPKDTSPIWENGRGNIRHLPPADGARNYVVTTYVVDALPEFGRQARAR